MTDIKSVFSPSQSAIYPAAYYADYVRAGTWPTDGIEISEKDAINFNGTNEPQGKMPAWRDNTLCWIDRPVPEETKEQMVALAEHKKSLYRSVADAEILWRQDAVELDMATNEEKSRYDAWRKYRVLLTRVDTSQAPDISWPEPPKD
ncbi:tail fiber assembly protein [Cedecea davisae]|uniref:Tail fiber assembly protein n=1 Tax=Cedecea davisae TaxID=158484 RepID=A0ABS6DB84_9ENTR|nr:tail fiber assembly protein [Cedecea davisae]MBU4680482.1 tail fiber assembly protein [Cedecea davisae]MBU4684974.1 tail fiber assembly protein [Cedecea davisae]